MPAERKPIALIVAATIMSAIFLPTAFAQKWFDTNPYLVPFSLLIVVVLLLFAGITSEWFSGKIFALREGRPMLSLITFIVAGAVIGTGLGAAGWWAVGKSKEHLDAVQGAGAVDRQQLKRRAEQLSSELIELTARYRNEENALHTDRSGGGSREEQWNRKVAASQRLSTALRAEYARRFAAEAVVLAEQFSTIGFRDETLISNVEHYINLLIIEEIAHRFAVLAKKMPG